MREVYELREEQLKSYEELRQTAVRQSEEIAGRIIRFIQAMHRKTGRPYVVIGLSGGIDSSLMATLCKEALGRKNVIGVKMPYLKIGSDKSLRYANSLVESLELPADNIFEMPINEAVDATAENLKRAGIMFGPVDKGNIMARERMKILYAIAGVKGGLVVDTCNKTEVFLGYFTRYGDGASDYNPVGGIYKTWVWELAKYLEVPDEIIRRKPTAELEAGQSDEDDLGISYPALDLMLWLLNERQVSKKRLTEDYYYPAEVVKMVVERVAANSFKSELSPMCLPSLLKRAQKFTFL
ncbi:MAG: NAD(+) synthase [Patescibacteria group bacterium]|nr:NAD(+) synthase [Patescibacteria group bacterium]